MSKRLRKVFKKRLPKKIQKIQKIQKIKNKKNKKNKIKKEKKAQPSLFPQEEDASKDFNFTKNLLKDLSESQELNLPDEISICEPIEKKNETKNLFKKTS